VLVFITSLRHPRNCNSWDRVCELAGATLASVCAQTCPDFEVIVVCNRAPSGNFPPKVRFLTVDFPAPSPIDGPKTGMHAIRMDRGAKYLAGAAMARTLNPSHVMFFDADDLLSNRIAGHVLNAAPSCGWYLQSGYRLRCGARRVDPVDRFHQHCGSSIIHRADVVTPPAGIEPDTPLDVIHSAVDEATLKFLYGSHRVAKHRYARSAIPFHPLPFPGAIWVLGTGENHSGKQGAVGEMAIDRALVEEFSIPDSLAALP
jgi:hypothetical protein